VLIPCKPFQPSLIFEVLSRGLPILELLKGDPLG
jgi:hypothetical protein